jgi:DUF438 domain-containing protein
MSAASQSTETWHSLLTHDHEIIERVIAAFREELASSHPVAPELALEFVDFFVRYAEGIHNKKEEQHLFPLLEQRGLPRDGGPLGVMLQEHETGRGLLAEMAAQARAYADGKANALAELSKVFAAWADLVGPHYWKENDILYPMGRRVLSEGDANGVLAGIEQVESSAGPDTRRHWYTVAARLTDKRLADLSAGLAPEVLAAMLNTLPVELSFVDANDQVRYFSHEHGKKIFPRTRGAIGTKVQQCHPQKSVHLVNRILEDFKAGKRQMAEFWITMQGIDIHIRYFAVRDSQGAYLGTLEVVQDVTGIKRLEGERRLLAEG